MWGKNSCCGIGCRGVRGQFFSPVPAAHMAGKPPALLAFDGKWDHGLMSVKRDKGAPLPVIAAPAERRPDHGIYAGPLSTQVLRSVGRRRHDAEAKLEQHLEEARHKKERLG